MNIHKEILMLKDAANTFSDNFDPEYVRGYIDALDEIREKLSLDDDNVSMVDKDGQ